MSIRHNLKIGISIHFNENFAESVDTVKATGFDAIDFDLCIYQTKRDKEIELYQHLEAGLEKVKESGLYFNAVLNNKNELFLGETITVIGTPK